MLSLVISAQAQPSAGQVTPDVRLVLTSADAFLADLDYIIKMTSKPEQMKVLREYMDDVFLVGADFKRPVRLDILFDEKGTDQQRYRLSLPVATKQDLSDFRKLNLGGFNIDTRPVRRTIQLYTLRDADRKLIGYMRWKYKYAILAEKRTDVPPKLVDPIIGVQKLLDLKYDIAAEGNNSPQGIAARHKKFAGSSKEILKALKRNEKKNETEEDFALRKMLFRHQLSELERIYSEAENLLLGWVLEPSQAEGHLDIKLKPLPGSAYEKTVKILGVKPSDFVNIPRTSDSVLSARIHLPLDDLRKKILAETSTILRAREIAEANAVAETTAEQKAAQVASWNIFFDMLNAILTDGVIDGFVEVHPTAAGKNIMVGALKSPDGHQALKIIELLPKMHGEAICKMNIDTSGDVKIHEVTLAATRHAQFNDLFGTEIVYIGTSKTAIWYAAGKDSLKELKAAILLAAKPAAEDAPKPIFDFYAKMHTWINLAHSKRKPNPKSKTGKYAKIAFANGNDVLTLKVDRKEDTVIGKLAVESGILRFVGELIADFSKENLSEE